MVGFSHEFKVTGLTPGQFGAARRAEIERKLMEIALYAQSEARKSIVKGPKLGHKYERGKTKKGKPKFHRASAPGQPPANDTGFLAGAIFAEPVKSKKPHEIAVRMVARAPYAVRLEFGTSKMAPRPFVRPAGDKAAERGKALFVDNKLGRTLRDAKTLPHRTKL